MASVRIEEEAFNDPRIAVLGELQGYSHYEALGRLAHLWRYCTTRGIYAVPPAIAERLIGSGGGAALLASELAEAEPNGQLRVRGTSGRIEWLQKIRAASMRGGEATKRKLEASRGPNGYPHDSHMAGHHAASTGPEGEPTPGTLTLAPTLALAPVNSDLERYVKNARPRGRPKGPRANDATEAELASVASVLGKLGAQNGVRYSGSEAHTRLIVGRLREGLSEMDLRKVVLYCAKAEGMEWATKPEMSRYLRPETLFGPTTIARYLDAARAWYETLAGGDS
jgi:uncharacterized phage protein (TIGR02220 family)